jgi:K+-transporting ATPase KdpF subunit
MSARASACEDGMSFDELLAGVIALGLIVYLTYALLKPERF